MRGAGKGWGSGAGPGTITGVETEAEVQPGPGGRPARAHSRGGSMCFSGRLFEQVEGISNTVNTGELDKTVRSYLSVRAALACTFRCAKTPANTVASGHERETGLNGWFTLFWFHLWFYCSLRWVFVLVLYPLLQPWHFQFIPSTNQSPQCSLGTHTHTHTHTRTLSALPNHWPYHPFSPLLLHTEASPPTSHKSALSAHCCYQAGASSTSWSTDNKALQQSIHVNNSFA